MEAEDPELLVAIEALPGAGGAEGQSAPRARQSGENHWAGRANLLDPHPLYRWPVITQVSQATRGRDIGSPSEFPDYPPLQHSFDAKAAAIILGRRSAQRFDRKFTMDAASFYRILDGLLDLSLIHISSSRSVVARNAAIRA